MIADGDLLQEMSVWTGTNILKLIDHDLCLRWRPKSKNSYLTEGYILVSNYSKNMASVVSIWTLH